MTRFPMRPLPLVLALAITSCAASAVAQTIGAPQSAGAPMPFAIEAQPLASALNEWARKTRIQLVVQQSAVAGRVAPAVSGKLSPRQALDQLLAGSGLFGRFEKNLVTIEPAPQGGSPAGATLAAVTVTADATRGEGTAEEGYRVSGAAVSGFFERPLLDTPFTVKVLPAELLSNQNIDNIGGLDRVDASVTASYASTSNYSTPFIRGLPLNNFSNYRINGMMLTNLQMVGLENKQRVEVLKGLSAMQAGFGSPGGIINFVTKRAADVPVNDVELSVNQYGNAKVAADISRLSDDGAFGLRLNVGAERLDSFVHRTRGDRQFLSVAADWRLTPDTAVRLDFEHDRSSQPYQSMLMLTATSHLPANPDPRTFIGQEWAVNTTAYDLLSGQIKHQLGRGWSLLLSGNASSQSRQQNTTLFSALQDNGNANVSNFYAPDQEYRTATLQAMVKGSFETGSVGHEVAVGASFLRYTWDYPDYFFGAIGSTNIYNPRRLAEPARNLGRSYRVVDTKERGAFVNDIMSFGPAWQWHVGGRAVSRDYTAYDSPGVLDGEPYRKSVFSPSTALVYKPVPEVSTYVSYVEGLENGGTAPLTANNRLQQLKPLTSKQTELGVKAELGNLLAEAALFQIDRPAEYTNAANVFVQDGNQRHRGADVSLTGRVNREWTLFGSLLLLDAKMTDTASSATLGKRPVGVPEHRVAVVAEYSPPALGGLVLSGNWARVGARPLNATNTGDQAPAYDIFGIGARYSTRINQTPVTVRLNIDNLFDRFYWATTSNALIAGAPRTVSLRAKFSF